MNENIRNISKALKNHYENTFRTHGASSAGVDWGDEESKANLRYKKMLALLPDDYLTREYTLLDVGCGYGGLLQYAHREGIKVQYTGIDLASNMISWAKKNMHNGEFIEGDFIEYNFDGRKFDLIVCNGILTQKLEASFSDMDKLAKNLIKKMFFLCDKGIAFNIMSTYVNFFSPNLYYKHPSEMLVYCLAEISQKVRLDHSYGLYEYTLYLYK
jgi:SAM-dependent methyltransferase